jgi:hypothetical protein
MNSVHVVKPYSFKTYFYVIRQSAPKSPKWSLPPIPLEVLRISHLSHEVYLAPVIGLTALKMCGKGKVVLVLNPLSTVS